MMQKGENPELIRRYLLGDLHEEQREEIELRLLTDEELQTLLSEAQDDLIDDYVLGILSERERSLFQNNFLLTPERLHKLRLSQALAKYTGMNAADSQASQTAVVPAAPWQKPLRFLQQQRFALAIAVIIIAVMIGYAGWSIYRHRQLETRVAELRKQRVRVEQELKNLNVGQLSDQQSMITLPLNQLVRDAGDKRLAVITGGINILQLRLELDEDKFSVYRAVIETGEGTEIYTVDELKAKSEGDAQVILLNLPSRLLPTGDYQVHLIGITTGNGSVDSGLYPFQVVLR
jgi:hypothetical protein